MDKRSTIAAILTVAYYAGRGPHTMSREQVVIDYDHFLELLEKTDGKKGSEDRLTL